MADLSTILQMSAAQVGPKFAEREAADAALQDNIEAETLARTEESQARIRWLATRALAVTAATTETWTVGAQIAVADCVWQFDGVSTAIADMPGWVPVEPIHPKHFGAADDIGLNAAISYVNSIGGGVVDAQNLNITLSAPIVLKSGASVLAYGSYITLADGANCDMVQTEDFYDLTGTGSYAATTPHGFSLLGGIWDGNRASQTPTNLDKCNGLSIYGYGYILSDLRIYNCAGHGARLEWGQYGEAPGGMESYRSNIYIDTCGRNGWWDQGPHDSNTDHLIVIDASQESDDTYCGILVEGYGNGRYYNPHPWHRSAATNRMRYAFKATSSGVEVYGGHMEGGRRQVYVQGARFYGVNIYAPYSSDPQLTVVGQRGVVNGRMSVNSAYPNPVMVELGSTDIVTAQNNIDLQISTGSSQGNPVINIAQTSGSNTIRVRSTGGLTTGYVSGAWAATDDVDIVQEYSSYSYRKYPARPSPFSAAGATQESALAGSSSVLRGHVVRVYSSASTETAVVMPPAIVGMDYRISNPNARAITVFPQSGESFVGLAANAGLSIGANSSAVVFSDITGRWAYIV